MNLTSAEIVADALQIAKCPGFTTQGGRAMNFVLDDLSLHRNLKANLVTSPIVVPANSNGPFILETQYLRTYDMFYLVDGDPYFLNATSLKQYDSENQLSGTSNYPYEWATDLSQVSYGNPGLMYIYPASTSGVTLTHRYYLRQYGISSPETSNLVPWFQDQDYLVTAIAARMMRITDDQRYMQFMAEAEKMLQLHLMTEGDEQQVVKEVILDPRRFRVMGNNRPTKLDPY